MKRAGSIVVFIAFILAGSAWSQSMMGSSPSGPAPSTDAMMAPADATGMGNKVIFTDLASARKLAERNPVVLFFAADWCPTCRAALKDIDVNGSRLGKATVVVVDYDKNADLKARYGVTAQHTYVQIDSKGAKLAVWNGGGVDEILSRLKKTM